MSKDDPEREARLRAALRTNLLRRKAQARAVEEAPDAPAPPRGRDGEGPATA